MKRFIEVHYMNPSWHDKIVGEEEYSEWEGEQIVVNVDEIVTLSIYDKSQENGYLKLVDGRTLILHEPYNAVRMALLKEDESYLTRTGQQISMMKWPIEELELSTRPEMCLKNAEIETIGELTKKRKRDLLNIRNMGRRSVAEIEERLADLGLSLLPADTEEEEEE